MARDHIFQTVMDATISASTPAQEVSVAGFRRYSVLARFEGQPGATFYREINNEHLMVAQERLQLGQGGWLNFAKEYTTFAPSVGIVIYHPPAGLKVKMTVYAGT